MARGLCSSPLSSADEAEQETRAPADEEVFAFEPDAPARKRKARGASLVTTTRRKAARRVDDAHPTGSMQATNANYTCWSEKSARELIAQAPVALVEFLAEQLGARQQAQLAKKLGAGQGFLVEVPAAAKCRKERQDTFDWLHALGFSSGVALPRSVLRISSLKADVIVRELHRRVLPNDDGNTGAATEAFEAAAVDDDEDEEGQRKQQGDDEVAVDIANDASIQSWKAYFSRLDAQKLEVVSFDDHKRLLSSARHLAIADAMEDVLAQPSLRKDRSRARRLSKLERISGRRFSVLPRMSSIAPILEDELESGEDEAAVEMPPAFLSPIKRKRASRADDAVLSAKKPSGKKKTSLFGEKILRLVLHAGFVPPEPIKSVICRVSVSWRRIGVAAYAWAVADYSKRRGDMRPMAEVYRRHPRGHYLADGAYKEVFKVFSEQKQRLEAVSVMDITRIESTGNQTVVQQEIAHSVLLSHLVETGACPNFLRIFDMFLAPEKPVEERWGSARRRKPVELLTDKFQAIRVSSAIDTKPEEEEVRPADGQGLFQYIAMEYCDGGDVEDFISLQKDKLLPAESVVVPYFFQMVFALYCAREQLHLRHCDVKLLNFFLKDIKRKRGAAEAATGVDATVIHYVVEQRCFELRLPPAFSYWIKLADYGSADSSAENIGQPVTLDQFTTLENTPVEFLLEGDAAKQSFAADTFSLGLCLLHLFTGCAPYEETLESVKCPATLLHDLKAIWTSSRKSSGFTVLKRVVQDDLEDTMYHTLYRFLVLFGLPSENPSAGKQVSKVWTVLVKHLRPDDAKPAQRSSQRLASTRAAERPDDGEVTGVKAEFERHAALFSVANGSNPIIARGRQRLQSVPGALDLLRALVDFDPTKRPTLKQVFAHPVFERLLASPDSSTAPDFVVDCYKTAAADRVDISDV